MFFRKYLILLLIITITPVYAEQYEATVIKVIDGDTIWIKKDNKHIKIRLSYIDAPELKQNFGIRSRNFLSNLVLDKMIEVNTNKKDRYNRHLGEIYIHNTKESIFVNAKMIKSGNAWVYKTYTNNPYLKNLEDYAKMNKKGLWNEQKIIEPWIFRRNK
jgi:endonuclease YncB( thermonuclease family)